MKKKFEKKELINKSKDLSDWYTDVILKAELADYAPIRGCMVFRPYGFAIWENMQRILDSMIKEMGVSNAYFPLLIPYSLLKKEKEHIKGFSPELAVVTHGGGKKISEPLVIRPTSETIIYAMYSKWIKSFRDLPLRINQWCNIVRWEKRCYLFLRTMEFLWQEGHTCHRTHREAKEEVERVMRMYEDFYKDFLAIPGFLGRKSVSEKFAGACDTSAYEILTPNGKVLQACSAHDLGQNFSKPFKISFQDRDGKTKYVWQTCWGLSTRSIGGLIMVHGDDQGLVLPPKIAPVQVIIIPIFGKGKDFNQKILSFSNQIKKEIEKKGVRVKFDGRTQYSPGWKFNEWEIKGVPLRIEIGKDEISGKFLTLVRRDILNERLKIKNEKLKVKVQELLDKIQDNLYKKAKKFLREHTHEVSNYQKFKKIMRQTKGFISAFWCEDPKCEAKIKEETKATIRCLPKKAIEEKGKCLYCLKRANRKWIFAQAY
ncbi:proline--tRNA ligase [Patescibacteria group bacterium]|nr:proline--tRNA ligase [Patescibacteria group bacterium]